MTLEKCVQAYKAVEQLMGEEFDYKSALALFNLKKDLQNAVDFYASEELKLIEELASRDEGGEIKLNSVGQIIFPDTDKAQAFRARRDELGKTDYPDLGIREVKAPAKIRPSLLYALSGFITFVE